MITKSKAALAAIAFFAAASAAGAQDAKGAADAKKADTYTMLGENGSDGAVHKETGAKCPGKIGDLVLLQVLSFDRQDDNKHLGIRCNYVSQTGFTGSISVVRTDDPSLVGAGDAAARWNRALYSILGNYPTALPANVEGLEGDGKDLRGALFTASVARLGLWQVESKNWQYTAQVVFVQTADGWKLAEETRKALIAAKAAADGKKS